MDQNQVKELRELIELLKANSVAEFDIEQPDFKVRLKFAEASVPAATVDLERLSQMMSTVQQPGAAAAAESQFSGQAQQAPARVDPVTEEVLHTVTSPIVGTFYESPSPGAPVFVRVGDQVEVGQVLCIIEAMKLMNEIETDVAGEVVQRIASSGQPVEYGQPLFAIRPR